MIFKLKIIYYWLSFKFRKRFRNREEIAQFQERQLEKFARKVLLKSEFYGKFFQGNYLNFKILPQISKKIFVEHFNEINTVGLDKDEALTLAIRSETERNFKSEINGITVGLSTGTSGKRSLFLASETERAKWAALVMTRVIQPKFLKKQRIAFFLRANSNLYSSVESSLFEFRYFDIFLPIHQLLNDLNDFQPHILAAQPSVLVDIALAQQNDEIDLKLSQIISFAEVLHDSDKNFIEETLHGKITEVYQCTEGFLGVSCEYGTMHLNEDFVKFEKEMIDNQRFYPIITDFSRHSQPVVNYILNDILVERTTPCKCGSSMIAIEKILGRDDDVLIFDEKKLYPDLISRRIALISDNFFQYQIKQINQNQLKIAIETSENDFELVKNKFEKAILQLLHEKELENIDLIFTNKIEVLAGNKLRKIFRELA